MADIEHLPDVFFELHRDLPREGPGDDASTLRALAMCTELPDTPDILDVACGPGMQTLALATATGGTITAVDMHEPFLDQLREHAEAAGVRDRLHVMRGDMADLPFGPDSFDLVWSEGAAYIMGISEALRAWREFLRPGGYIVVSEATWLVPDPPAEVREFWAAEYPGMRDIEGNLERFRPGGFEVIGHFTLPDESWWTHYQSPLEARIPALLETYAGDAAALAVINGAVAEHRIRRRYPDTYGYEFYVARCDCPEGPGPESSWQPSQGGDVVWTDEPADEDDAGRPSDATAEADPADGTDRAEGTDRADGADRPQFPPPLD